MNRAGRKHLQLRSTISKTRASGFIRFPNARKHLKPRGLRPRGFIFFLAFGNLMKPEARVFEMSSPKKQYKIRQCCIFFPFFFKMPCMCDLLYSVGIHCICELLFLIIQ